MFESLSADGLSSSVCCLLGVVALSQLEKQMESLVNVIPNLLDDRVPEGDDDTQNLVVRWVDHPERRAKRVCQVEEVTCGLGFAASAASGVPTSESSERGTCGMTTSPPRSGATIPALR